MAILKRVLIFGALLAIIYYIAENNFKYEHYPEPIKKKYEQKMQERAKNNADKPSTP